MKTIQITLLDELHRRAKALALANTTLKPQQQPTQPSHPSCTQHQPHTPANQDMYMLS